MKKKFLKIINKMDLLKDLKMSLLTLALLKKYLNYLKDSIFGAFLRSIADFF